MITKYIEKALRHAHIEKMEDGRYFSTIQGLQGVWADGDTKEECQAVLREVLEEWFVLALRDDDDLPAFDGVSLNFGGKRRSARLRSTSRSMG
ncbi:MAG: type II toxin-antitoxin system HicB family antitoxin [Dehalococcoidia bacterium]